MSASNFRWRISEAVRRTLFRTGENHPLRRIYNIVRTVPGVRVLWRAIDARRPTETGFAKLVSGGAVFGPSAPHDAASLPAVVAFDDPKFFPNLIARIRACEPHAGRHDDTVVLVNNGLSAGGAERQIVNTMLGLKARGVPAVFIGEYLKAAPSQDFHLDALVTAGGDARELERITAPGARVFENVSMPVARQLFRIERSMLLEILDMVRALRAINPRAVHLWQDQTSVKHAISALIAGVPRIVLSGRNLNPTHFAYHQDYMRPAYHALLTQPGVVLSNNSHAGALSYATWLGIDQERIRVVHNGFDFRVWPPASDERRSELRKRFGVPGDAILVAGAFRLSPEKRPLLWVETAAEALNLEPRLHFIVAGEGDMKRDVETRISELGLDHKLTLAGRMSDVDALFMASDAVMLTSQQEGIPNVLLEAQWYGRPVLATRAGGAEEAIQDGVTGRVSDESTPAALARALVNLVRDDALRLNAATSAQHFITHKFSIDRMIDETLDLYRA
jgi:glycosyltransferase involved in cell wall biosynthesis